MVTTSTCWVENINEKLFQLVFRKSVNILKNYILFFTKKLTEGKGFMMIRQAM